MSKRILIVRTDRVGDVVTITPVIRELRRTFPDAYIATLTQPNTSEIFLNNPHLDEILIDDLKKDTFRKVVKEIRIRKFDYGLLMMPTKRAAYQLFFGGVKNRIGVGRKLYEVLTLMKSVSRNNYIPLRHEGDYCMDLARKIGVRSDNIQPEIFITPEEIIQRDNFYRLAGIEKKAFKIILHTGSLHSSSNWNENKYFELIKNMLSKFKQDNIVIILTALEMSSSFKDQIAALNEKKIVEITSHLGALRKLITIISGIDLMISSSTGPIHIADALDKRCIGLYCHRPMNSARIWGVLNKKSINLEVSKEYCDTFCSKDKSICSFENGISIDEVLEQIRIV